MTTINNILRIKIGVLAAFCCIAALPGFSQFYYKDLVTTQQINYNYKLYKENKVSTVKLNSFQGSTPITEGFICEQKLNAGRNQLVTYTRTDDAGETFLTSVFNQKGLLITTVDSSTEAVNRSTYSYDDNNRLVGILVNTRALDNSSVSTETHSWQYTSKGKPLKMIRVKNGTDSAYINFTLDEKGNVADEEIIKKGLSQGKVYYYYDDKNRLTDVVRYNVKAKRLLPDYIFEYEDDELSTMTLIPEGSDNYQKWYYKYDENGLKQVDFCYDKKNALLGKVEYVYQFNK